MNYKNLVLLCTVLINVYSTFAQEIPGIEYYVNREAGNIQMVVSNNKLFIIGNIIKDKPLEQEGSAPMEAPTEQNTTSQQLLIYNIQDIKTPLASSRCLLYTSRCV